MVTHYIYNQVLLFIFILSVKYRHNIWIHVLFPDLLQLFFPFDFDMWSTFLYSPFLIDTWSLRIWKRFWNEVDIRISIEPMKSKYQFILWIESKEWICVATNSSIRIHESVTITASHTIKKRYYVEDLKSTRHAVRRKRSRFFFKQSRASSPQKCTSAVI